MSADRRHGPPSAAYPSRGEAIPHPGDPSGLPPASGDQAPGCTGASGRVLGEGSARPDSRAFGAAGGGPAAPRIYDGHPPADEHAGWAEVGGAVTRAVVVMGYLLLIVWCVVRVVEMAAR